ncbi:MAG: cinnamycin family lantibiotic [Moorea sp. SIOASIH]|uniref:cinnamycin family lantibiotic n=1 Tax=Moorena sp. SIOASIH TaxID=2607817 RepID=UPI0013BC62C2|nr:cinnamycin family lantibiotic [Moorena sp. SIOASIH]NEO39949.1 cinnamycin family lantibiotic [Moorena sp. SIOASIH]
MSTATLEKVLHQASIDAEFRSEVQNNPEAFGLSATTTLPESVEKQDHAFIELLNASLGEFDIAASCESTCSSGPLTIVCDGTTKN